MSIYSQFETDTHKEADGVPMYFIANRDGTIPEIRVARTGGANIEYLKALEEVTRPFADKIRFKALPQEKYTELYTEAFARGVIKGWSNILGRDGSPLEFSVENAVKLLTDLPELYNSLIKFAENIDNFNKAQLEEDVKN